MHLAFFLRMVYVEGFDEVNCSSLLNFDCEVGYFK